MVLRTTERALAAKGYSEADEGLGAEARRDAGMTAGYRKQVKFSGKIGNLELVGVE